MPHWMLTNDTKESLNQSFVLIHLVWADLLKWIKLTEFNASKNQ